MSRIEERSLFRRFGRTALALSLVTTNFVLADQTIATNANQTDYLENGETNITVAMGIDSNGENANVTVNSGIDVSGAIIAGELRGSGLPITAGQTDTFTYFSANDSTGATIGLDVNTSITNLVNLGNIGATIETLESYVDNAGVIRYPDQNNTTLTAIAVNVDNAIVSLDNSGNISATATLNNDTNNSSATAVAVLVSAPIGQGIVNNTTGSITATASTHDLVSNTNNRLVAEIGGRHGNGGQEISTANLGDKAKYVAGLLQDTDTKVGSDSTMVMANNNLSHTAQTNTRMVSDTRRYNDRLVDQKDADNYASQSLDTDNRPDFNDQFHIVNADGQAQKDKLQEQNFIRTDNGGDNNSHMHRGTFSEANLGSPGDLDNVITATGIKVDAAITGGIINHGYISSVLGNAALTGSADGNEVGLTVTPNTGALAGADTAGLDLTATVPATAPIADPTDPAPTPSGNPATGGAGGATYAVPATDNGILAADDPYRDTALAEAEASIQARYDALGTPTTAAEQATYDTAKAVIDGEIDTAAIKADIEGAYQITPDIQAEIDAQVLAATPAAETPPATATAGAAPTDGFKDGVHTARIGNTILNAATTGGTAQGILVRASSATNVSDEINATTGQLNASNGIGTNPDNNANVTSGTVSAYLGEGVDAANNSRVITRNDNRLTNSLIGGLENNSDITAGAGFAGVTLTSDAIAVADRAEGIEVNQYSETNATGTTIYDINANPTSIVGIGTLMNTGTMTGGAGAAGLELLSTSTGGISAIDANITGHELIVSPTSITNVRELINTGDIVGGMGGNALNGKALAVGSITATDINLTAGSAAQTEGLTVRTYAEATLGNFFSSGLIDQSLGADAIKLEADGSAKLAANTITDSIVNVETTSIGGIRKVFGKDGDVTKLTEGNLLNAGTISVALSANAVNMHAEGLAVLSDKDGAAGTTAILNSNINVSNETITGVEGNFVNVAWTGITDDATLERSAAAKRGTITASLAADAIHLTANGTAKLEPLSIENSNVTVTNTSTSGVGETFANYGTVSVALSANAANFSSVSTATLGLKDETTIIAGTTTVSNISTSGVRGDFINGASAIEIGTLNETNTSVHNPTLDYTDDNVVNPTLIKEHDGYYEIAANINETNSSDTNSTGAHSNDVLAGQNSSDNNLNQLTQVTVHAYDKEAAIVSGAITAALATDAVKFDSTATGDLKVVSIGASTEERIDIGDSNANNDIFVSRATVKSVSISDSSIGGNFINNGVISVALAAEGVNGVSTATGTLGSSADNNVVEASTVSQYTASRSGVQGDFINEAVSREVGAATVFTAQSGSEEIGAFTYGRATNIGQVSISSALAANAVTLESHATNLIDLKESSAAKFVHDSIGSGVADGAQTRNLAGWKSIAGATRSELNSTTTSIAGVGGNFSNTGTISAALAANAFDALADGTNDLGKTGFTVIEGTNVTAHMSSVAGVQGNFTNDIQSLKDGSATLVYRDVYNIDENNAQVSPRYYDNEDAKEGERVKSNVVDRVVYDRALAQGSITAALAADAINLDATGTTNILADRIGTGNVKVVTNHTGYATDNNATQIDSELGGNIGNTNGILDSDRIIKVTSEDVKATSVVVAGIGGQFTNRNIISTALAKNALTAMGTATTTLGMTGITEIEGGNVLASTLVIAGIGNDFNTTNNEGFLNAAGTYDAGAVQIGTSKVIATENNSGHLILAENSNDAIAATDRTLNLIDSNEVVYWNRQAPIVGAMSAALAKDVVKVDGVNAGSVIPKLITAAMGDVNVTVNGVSSMVAVVGEHVEGTARANVSTTSTVIAGINGGLTNQGKLTSALAGNVIMAQADGTGIIGDATTTIQGSTVTQNTTTIAGVQDGDFVNETLSFETDNGEVVTTLVNGVETPTVVFDRATTDGSVVMSVALAKTVAQLEALSTNNVTALRIEAASGVKYGGEASTWEIGSILSSARAVTSDVNSSTTSVAGVSGNFYNSGKIDVALSKDAIDAIADAKNTLGTATNQILGSNVIASSTAISGIRGDFTNDVVTLDDGAKYIVKKDVVDENGDPVYQQSGDTAPGERIKSNVVLTNSDDQHHENTATGHGIAQVNNSGDGVATDGAVYAQLVVEGEIGVALAGDAIKVDATGTNDIKPATIKEAEVTVVRMNVQTTSATNDEIHATANEALTVDVTSDTTATTTVIAGIGGNFTNRSSKEIKTALAKNAITAISTATTSWGDAGTTIVQGGTHIANTTVVAGIGNGETENNGFSNLADSYNTGINTGITTQIASNNVAGHALNDVNANAAIATDSNNSLPLIDSAEVVYWDNTIVVGKITASLAKDTLNLEAFSTGNLTPNKALAVVNDVNVSDTLQAVAGYHVEGSSVGANITQVTQSTAGIFGNFLNEGEISTSLAGNVLNARGTATGTVGDVGNTIVVGSSLDGTTVVVAGIQAGDFNNTVKSLDKDAATVVTVLDENGIETPKVVFSRETTDGKVKLAASLSKDVVLLDVTAKNVVDAVSIDASEYVLSTAGNTTLDAAKSGMSNVIGRSIAIGGIGGSFYNTGIIEASLSLNAITTQATSNNDLGSGALTIKGSNVTATSYAYARISDEFINDAVLLDTGAPKINYDLTAEGNTSNVAGSVTYDQQLVKGTIKSDLSKDVLSLVATGNNDINIASSTNTAVKVVSITANDLNADANHSVSEDQLISSNIQASSVAHSGIGGVFINAGTLETALGTDVINMQAVGGPANITVLALGGGSVEGNNTVLSGINLAATSTLKFGDIINDKKYTSILPAGIDLSAKADDIVGFLNDKRDFNTVLESDTTSVTAHTTPLTGHQAGLVATGTIKADLAQVTVNMLATGGVSTTITADAGKIYTTDVDANSPYGTATVSNIGNNNVVIQGDFVNLGDIKTGTAGHVLNMIATNEATTDLGTLTADTTADTGGLVMSTAISNVGSYIAGDIINTGEMSSGTAGNVIAMEAIGGISAITLTMADHNLTDWAANNGKVVASNVVNTNVATNNIINTGLIKTTDGIAIKLNAEGAADSSAFVNNATNTALAGNAIVVNHVDSNVSIQNLTNIGEISSATANAIEIHATGSAKRATNEADVNLASYEDTSARVNASVADISNIAFTRQNALWEVNSAFNTDGNASTDDQLRPTEETVAQNLGEYDLTSGAKIDSNSSTYSSEAQLDRLAYGDGADINTSAPILSQTVGIIKADLGNAIDIIARATESNSTLVTASTGHILNSGIIDASGAGIGINIAAIGAADPSDVTNQGARAEATVGVIANLVVDDTFKIGDLAELGALGLSSKAQKDDVVHAILTGEILGATAGIKIDAVNADDKGVSVATVDQIVNYRRVLNQGDYVISSAGADTADGAAVDEAIADGKVANNGSDFTAVDSRVTDNYGITQLTVDGVYNAVIGSDASASSIIVGENAHVTDGILNYGELVGKVEIGDADLYLYGLVQNADRNITFGARAETDEMGLTDNYFAVTDGKTAYIDATDHTQVAGMVTAAAEIDDKVVNAVVGSNIFFNNSHILKGGTYEADHITIGASSIVNVDADTTFVTETAATPVVGSTATNGAFVSNPFDVNLSDGVHNMFTNSGYLNVRAGQTATVTGNYEQKGGFFVTNVETSSITAGLQNNQHDATGDGGNFGQLDVSGNADLTGGILVMMDDVGTNGEAGINLDAATTAAGAETRLVDVIKATTLSADGTDLTHAGHTGAADSTAADLLTGVKVQDNSRLYDFEVVNGTTTGGVSLRIAAQDPNAAPIAIDTTNVAISAIKTTSRIIAERIDSRPSFAPSTVVNFTSTSSAPEFVPNVENVVVAPENITTTTPTSTVESRVTVLSQSADAGILGDISLNSAAQIQPSLGDFEIAKVSDLNQTKKLNMWGKIYYSHAEQDGDAASKTKIDGSNIQLGQAGYTSNSYGLIAGADKQYGEWFVGTAVALGKSIASTTSGASTSSETTMFQVTEYGSHPTADGRVNVQGSFAYLTNDKDRTDGYLGDGQGSDAKNYNSNYNGYALNAAVEYEQGFTVNKDTMLIPYVGLSGVYVSNNGYTEKGGNNAQEVSGASSTAVIASIGTRAQYKVTENSAIVANVGIGYDMIAESVEYEARTALNANSQTLHIEGATPEALEYEIGLGYQFVTPGNTIIRANVDYRARDGYKDTTGSVKVYLPF